MAFILTDCSLYKSDARKFLEKQAFEYAGVAAQANLLSCPGHTTTSEWALAQKNDKASVFLNEERDFEMLVVPSQDNVEFSCAYRFDSAQEMFEKTEAAIELTLWYMNQGMPVGP